MADVKLWKNVAINMQSAIATAKTITDITKADPAVVTSVSHGYSDGDIVFLEVSGMYQLNDKAVRVASSSTDTFALEGVDSTDFDTFSSGTCAVVTMGSSITTALDVSASGGDFSMIDTTTIHDSSKTEVPGLPNPTSYSMTHIWDSTDAGQIAMKAASDNQAKRVFKFDIGSKIFYFAGYVGFSGLPGGSAQDKVTTQSVITMSNSPSYYSS